MNLGERSTRFHAGAAVLVLGAGIWGLNYGWEWHWRPWHWFHDWHGGYWRLWLPPWMHPWPHRPITPEPPAYCTQDVRQCPDGSYVNRVPPHCQFRPCPGVAR